MSKLPAMNGAIKRAQEKMKASRVPGEAEYGE
jgi:hypothetical protein